MDANITFAFHATPHLLENRHFAFVQGTTRTAIIAAANRSCGRATYDVFLRAPNRFVNDVYLGKAYKREGGGWAGSRRTIVTVPTRSNRLDVARALLVNWQVANRMTHKDEQLVDAISHYLATN